MNNSRKELLKEQQDLIERYITAYNKIDHYLRDYFNEGKGIKFSRLVKDYASKNPRWRDEDRLLILADLRNLLVHERVELYTYLSVPTLDAVQTIEQIRDRLLAPERVLPRFQKEVVSVDYEDRLAQVLAIIDEQGYSQFPVYRDRQFIGLLTENGVTRWLAGHVSDVLPLVDFTEEKVGSVLAREEQRPNYDFIPRDFTVLEAENKFAIQTYLEALFITHNGKRDQALLGIITRWDLLTSSNS